MMVVAVVVREEEMMRGLWRTGIWKGTKLREGRGRQGRVGAGPEK